MKVKVSELEGVALDWAVAKAANENVNIERSGDDGNGNPVAWLSYRKFHNKAEYKPSADWSQCGPLIDIYEIDFHTVDVFLMGKWVEAKPKGKSNMNANSRLLAACRAIVAAELGEEVDIPDELVSQ